MPTKLKSPRQIQSQMVKDKLLSTTIDLIKKHGFEYVTVNNICTTAKVSTGSFYHHFTNKDDLLAYYLVAAFEQQSAEFNQLNDDDVLKNVLRCYELYTGFLLEQGIDFMKNYYTTKNKGLMTRNCFTSTKNTANIPIMFQTCQLLTEACKNGYISDARSPEDLSEDLCIIEKGVVLDWCICDGSYNLNQYAQELLKNYLLSFVTPIYHEQFPAK